MRRWPGILLGVLALGGLAVPQAAPYRMASGTHFVVEIPGDPARILHRERASPGALFSLDYVHSSERVPVRGTFRIERDGSLAVLETAFGGFGPGLPELGAGDDWRIEDHMIVHQPRVDPLTELRVRVTPIAHQRLTTPSGLILDLPSLVAPGAAVRVRIR